MVVQQMVPVAVVQQGTTPAIEYVQSTDGQTVGNTLTTLSPVFRVQNTASWAFQGESFGEQRVKHVHEGYTM